MEEEIIVEQNVYKIASRRVGFKIHVAFFIIILAMLWIIWAFIFKPNESDTKDTFLHAILFVNSIWLLILISHYLIVYRWNKTLIEKEIKKIKKEKEKLIKLKKEVEEKKELLDSTENN